MDKSPNIEIETKYVRETQVLVYSLVFSAYVYTYVALHICRCLKCESWMRKSDTLVKSRVLKRSAWKSSPKTGKRPRLDWTKTAEDRKFPGPSKTATAVRSSVSNDFGNLKTDKRPV
jgi:hypothetical protein